MNVFYVVILKYDDISYLDEHGILCRLYSYLNVLYDVDDSKHYCSCKTWKGKDGGVYVDSDGTNRTDPGQGNTTVLCCYNTSSTSLPFDNILTLRKTFLARRETCLHGLLLL